jgi:simple sugar transport system permease protein
VTEQAVTLSEGRTWILVEQWGEIVVLVLLIVFFQAVRPAFLTTSNLDGISQSVVVLYLVSLGVMMSVSVGGFDLSVGSIVSLSSVLSAGMMVLYQWPVWVAIALPIAIGAGVGVINGLVIVRFGVLDIVATLGMMFVISGVQETYSGGENIYPKMVLATGTPARGTISHFLTTLGSSQIGPVPITLIIIVAFGALMLYLMDWTRWGRYFYAVGDNRDAAAVAGIPVGLVRVLAYTISGALAAAGGVLLTGILDSGNTDVGSPYLLQAVTTVFLGVTVFGRARANVFGTFIGCAFLGIMLDGLTLVNMPYTSQQIFEGGLLLVAVVVGVLAGRRREGSGARALD